MAKRIDTHKVYVSLALGSSATASAASLQNYLFPAQRNAAFSNLGTKNNSLFIGASVTAQPRTPAEAIAANSNDQARRREIQFHTGSLTEEVTRGQISKKRRPRET